MTIKALILTGYGLNCDYETAYSFEKAGAHAVRHHINELVGTRNNSPDISLDNYHILVFGGGFSWGDNHGAGVLMAAKIQRHLGDQIESFIKKGKLIIGICNGFQVLVNLGLLPAVDNNYKSRHVALINNDSGNFIDDWVHLKVNPSSPCIFTKDIDTIDLPVRHGEGKFYAPENHLSKIREQNQIVFYYTNLEGKPANGEFPYNPNGSLFDIAGICDPTGRILGLMPHPEGYNHFTSHPLWTRRWDAMRREGISEMPEEGDGLKLFQNAVAYIRDNFIID